MLPALLLILAAPAPEAAFTLDDGDVRLRLTRDGRPIREAFVQVYTGNESRFGDGEVEDGVARFPAPPNPTFHVGIKIDGKECDLIPVEKHGATLTPARVSLTFGTRPCCRNAVKPRDGQSPPPEQPGRADTGMVVLALVGGVCLLGAVFVLLLPRGGVKA